VKAATSAIASHKKHLRLLHVEPEVFLILNSEL